jgi:hypothetical protein
MDIFLTLDYELFSSDKPGTPKHCIVDPMNALSEVAGRYGVNFSIFVDAAYILKLWEYKDCVPQLADDFEIIKNNLLGLVSQGHDVQLHFHPQWIYTTWSEINECWEMDTVHFKLSDMDSELAKTSFAQAKQLLDQIIGYSTTCFRACGYCLETYQDYINLFKDNGITKDSSVLRKCYLNTPVHNYDYRVIPKEHIYRFSNSVREKDDEGQFKELSISTFDLNFLSYYIIMREARQKYRHGYVYKDGEPLSDGHTNRLNKILGRFKTKNVIASLDALNSSLLPFYLSTAERLKQSELIICGHPKNASQGSLQNLNGFLSLSTKNHRFLTVKDI